MIKNVKFETALHTREDIEAVIRDGVKAEGVLTQPFIITFDWGGDRWQLEVPLEYAAGPSVPPFLRSITPATGAIRWASYPHDFGYEFHIMSRSDLDDLFVATMRAAGMGWFKRRRGWLGVRLGGWFGWGKHEGNLTLKGLTRIKDE